MTIKHALVYLLVITVAPVLQADEFLTSKQIANILEADNKTKTELSAAKKVYFCWSKPDHPKHVHGYERFAKTFASQLSEIDNIDAEAIKGYPTNEQWKSADLVVFNLTLNNLSPEQLAAMDDHLSNGGSVIVVHQGLVQRVGYQEWAKRIGLAFTWAAPPTRSKWGKGVLTIDLNTKHEIFKGFPETIQVDDELYWNLAAGGAGELTILGETIAPKPTKKKAGSVTDTTTKWPAFWTVEHPAKEEGGKPGRVFCCVISHPDKVAFSSSFGIVMKRAIAWCMSEPVGPFLQKSESANTQ